MLHRKLKLVFVAALILWPVVFFGAAKVGWIWSPIADVGHAAHFMHSAVDIVRDDDPPNAAFALIRDGKVSDEFFISQGKAVDRNTLYQVMSISKWVTAWVVLTLVESRSLHLDVPIQQYLSIWQPPESQYDMQGVTVRRLLSHSAGVNKGDFEGFLPDQEMQSLVDFMTKPADGGAHGNVRIDQSEPGTAMRYSNNGYALLQHIVEQVTGEPFEVYAAHAVLKPLQMTNSTFDTAVAKTRSLTEFYDASGNVSIHRRYGAVAPSSLYTSTADLAKFVIAHVPGDAGELPGRGVLKPETVELMQQAQTPDGSDPWGLGIALFGNAGDYTFGHNGVHFSDPSISTEARINPRTRNGVIALVSGRRFLAAQLAMEWDYWETGRIQVLLIALKGWIVVLLGWFVLVCVAVALKFRSRGSVQ